MQHTNLLAKRGRVADEVRTGIYYSEADKALVWDRRRKGESLGSIARHFDRHHSAIIADPE